MKYFWGLLLFVGVLQLQAQERYFSKELQLVQKYTIEEKGDIRELKNKGQYFIGNDVANQKILVFSKDFKVLKKLGGKGNGPGEFLRIVGFDGVKDSIWVIDGIKKKYLICNDRHKEIYRRELSGFVRNGTVFDGNILYQSGLTASNDFLFVFYDNSGLKRIWDIKDLIDEEFSEGISYIYQGSACSDNSYAVYYCRYAPYFFCFDKNGFRYVKKSIVPLKPPKGKVKRTSIFETVELSHEYPIHSYGCIFEDELFLLCKIVFEGKDDLRYFNVDVYNVKTGDYKYSLKIPAKNSDNYYAISLLIDKKCLYVFYENAEIQKFNICEK